MSYPNIWLHVLNHVSDIIQRPSSDPGNIKYSAAATGAHDVLFTQKYLRKFAIRDIPNEKMSAHACGDTAEFHLSSYSLAAQVLKSYGYDSYNDIDIYDRAKIVCDLSKPISSEYHHKFDLMMDITSTYVTDIIQSYTNTSKMTKIGGIKIVVTTIGDHTNRFELNPSPNFLIDFHLRNGFSLARAFLINPKGTILPYRRYSTKSTPAFVLLPFTDWLLTLVKTIYAIRIMRWPIRKGDYTDYPAGRENKEVIKSSDSSNNCEKDSQLAQQKTPRRIGARGCVKGILTKVLGDRAFKKFIRINRKWRYARRSMLHETLSPEWYAYFVFHKISEVDNPSVHVTSHYEELDQTN